MSRFAYILALFSLLAMAFVPSGYMVAVAEDGSFTVRICSTSHGHAMEVSHDRHSSENAHHHHETHHHEMTHETEHEGGTELCDVGPPPVGDLGTSIELIDTRIELAALHAFNRPVLSGIFPAALPPSTGPPLS